MPLKPLALGIVQIGSLSAQGRRKARVTLAAYAHQEGYALLDTVELGTSALRDELTVRALVGLAERNTVRAVITAGAVNATRLRQAGLPVWMTVLVVPARLPHEGVSP